jgi:phosphoenolpyruvate-protein kinase (PTS system EI component)
VLGRTHLPSEDEQATYFARVLGAFPRGTVTIRTYDLGGDKFPAAFDAPPEDNPSLGWRSIRVCLDHPHIFRPQLRALLRAGVHRRLQVMLPLVTRVDEVLQTRELVAEEAEALARAGVPAASSLSLGTMIETPAAVVIADRLARVCDFFSVGTNDLTQYTLAAERGNASLEEYADALHPAVLRLIKMTVESAHQCGKWAGVCGEVAADPLAAPLLVGMGVDELSMNPAEIPRVKAILRAVDADQAAALAERALGCASAAEVRWLAGEFDLN